ncbi:hypothetical protein MG293_000999 [Ovis ammon polii]|uniref:Uncharacterized protein n=1 Tax=Ovis ammon polii TaxID=230172 RepID=A0AAD4UPI0_OVIAM|nr:hypothetical protein MG293_000999 [Ovis ammon polii]
MELSTPGSDPEPQETLPLRQQEDLGPRMAKHRGEEAGAVHVRNSGGKEIPLIQVEEEWLCFPGAAVKSYPTPKWSLPWQLERNCEFQAVIKRNTKYLLQIEKSPESIAANREVAPTELKRSSESPASAQEELSWQIEIRPQHN